MSKVVLPLFLRVPCVPAFFPPSVEYVEQVRSNARMAICLCVDAALGASCLQKLDRFATRIIAATLKQLGPADEGQVTTQVC